MRLWLFFTVLVSTGCGSQATYVQSKHQLVSQQEVVRHQPGWVPPARLKIHSLPDRGAVHRACNDSRDGGKGSHYSILGMHWASIQDRGCYIHSPELSVGHVFYLAGDSAALDHEKLHHYHGPAHLRPRVPISHAHAGYARSGRTGTRIYTGYGPVK